MAVSLERKAYLKKWRQTEKAKAYQREYHRQDSVKADAYKYRKQHRIDCPWLTHLEHAQTRCKNPRYVNYSGKEIRCFLTVETIKGLWFRDKAYLLVQPSIDRKDSSGDYTVENCRFIELKVNQAQGGFAGKGKHSSKYANISLEDAPGELV